MKGRQERLNKVFRYLLGKGKVSTQKDFAEKIKMSRPALSAAMNGNGNYLTENLMSRIVAFFPEISFVWLKDGDGTMLVDDLTPKDGDEKERGLHIRIYDINDVIEMKDEIIASLKRELASKDETIQVLKEAIEALKRAENETPAWQQTPVGAAEETVAK